jgi:hypothetical protein
LGSVVVSTRFQFGLVELGVEIGWRGPWERIADAVELLRTRHVNGKALLDLRPVAQ